MNIALLGDGRRHVLEDPTLRHRIVNLSFGLPGAAGLVMTRSAAATPGRYIAEMARRMHVMDAGDTVAVINPAIELSAPELGLVAQTLIHREPSAAMLVVSDAEQRPLAYRIPGSVAANSEFLSLLSAVEAASDRDLLSAIANEPVASVRLPVPMAFRNDPGSFHLAEHQRRAYRWLAQRAATEVAGGRRPALAVILPFHAGDLLFLLLALKRTGAAAAACVVDRRYRDIVEDVAPELACIEVDIASGRSQAFDWDPALVQLMTRGELPSGYVYSYYRPSLAYDLMPIHLIDQYAFACSLRPPAATLRNSVPLRRWKGRGARRVVCHFDGGWPLKVYPDAAQRQLVGLLRAAGFAVSVIASRADEEIGGVRSIRIQGLAHLRSLLDDADLLIGMDSFPVHYAAHVLGMPTICLFASTQPANSDAAPSPQYSALQAGLDCCPCRAVSRCPRYGGSACRNFSAPEVVAEAVRQMWSTQYLAVA